MEPEKPLLERIYEAEAEYRLVLAVENVRQGAEIAYVLAKLYQEAGDSAQARHYAARSVALFQEADVTSLKDAKSRYDTIAGVIIPSLIHEDVVRRDFPEFGL